MGAKKKKGKKGKKGKKKDNKAPPKLVIPDYIPPNPDKIPIGVIVHYLDNFFLLYSEEYRLAQEFYNELSNIMKIPSENMKLYFSNKRLVERDSTLHDQGIVNKSNLYLIVKTDTENNTWDNINTIINYDIYKANDEDLKLPSEEINEEK